MMRKILPMLFLIAFSLNVFAQNRATNDLEAPSVAISVENLTPFTLDAVFTPNDSCAYYNFLLDTDTNMAQWSSTFNTPVEELVSAWCTGNIEGTYTFNYTNLTPNKEYVIYARPFNSDSVAFPMDTIHIITPNTGGIGLATIEIEISDITDSSVVMTATPNDQTSVFYDGIITTEAFNELGVDSVIKIIQASPYPQYETDVWNWIDLSPGTAHKGIAIGKNSNEEWGDTTIVDFVTLEATGILYKVEDKYKVYPQPNNGTFTFESPYSNGEVLTIFDVSGKAMYKEKLYDNKHLVNASYLENGVYFLRVGKERSVLKIVINK